MLSTLEVVVVLLDERVDVPATAGRTATAQRQEMRGSLVVIDWCRRWFGI
jgi:hypothetical protein